MFREKKHNNIGDRSKVIMTKAVESYLKYGHPVSSSHISKCLNNSLSPSSIRVAMANLENLGLLYSPHTSAGRVPTDKGLKFFVDGLLELGDLSEQERNEIETRCNVTGRSLLEVLNQASNELSGLSQCTSLVLAPSIDKPLKHIEFVPLDLLRALVVTVDINGLVENKLIDLPKGLPRSGLTEASNYVNSRIYGKTLEETKILIDTELEKKESELDELSEKVVSAGIAIKSENNGDDHFLLNRRDLILNDILLQQDINRLNKLFIQLDNEKNFSRILKSITKGTGVHVFIGANSDLFDLAGCSMIIAPLKRKNIENKSTRVTVGAIGVIGPTRLNYARIIPMVDFTAKVLNKFMG